MSRRNKLFKKEEHSVRAILNEWDPLQASPPPDEYDCLNHRVLSVLHSGSSRDDLKSMIEREMLDHFGFEAPKKGVEAVTDKLWAWWLKSKAK